MKEVFKDVPGYEGLYQVSNLGNVKSLRFRKEIILKTRKSKHGYLSVILYKYVKPKTIKVHQLVAMAFLNHTPCGFKKVVNHINFDKTDNILENLEVITHRKNTNLKHFKNSSKYVGVHWAKDANKWKCLIHVNGKQKYLGYFTDELEASNAYQKELKQIK